MQKLKVIVYGHLVNSTHNRAILTLIETKILVGNDYNDLYQSLKKDVVYPYKDLLIRLLYKII